ncbi:hypothetical protein CEP89_06300 [Streptobacillus moniliformis]|nr:hypothetical protein CEP89_06300 [Streptobacillus moniliformis]
MAHSKKERRFFMKKIFVILSILFLGTINFSEESNGIEFKKSTNIEFKEDNQISLKDIENTGLKEKIIEVVVSKVVDVVVDKVSNEISERFNGTESEKKETEKEIHEEKKVCPPELNGTCYTE